MPRSARNAFSRARCCVMWRAAPLGRTGTNSAAASAADAGHVLEFEGDHVDAAGEGADGVEIVVVGGNLQVGHLPGRRVRAGDSVCTR